MPFTPFHMGPALALKALSARHFSVLVFGIAQVAMDIEPLIGMIRGADVLHGSSHTWIGATLIGVPVALLAPALCRPILGRWNRELTHHGAARLVSPPDIGRVGAATGAFVGTWSHVALDSIMHADVAPLSPWSAANAFLGAVSIGTLHLLCVAAGVLGVAAWLVLGLRAKPKR